MGPPSLFAIVVGVLATGCAKAPPPADPEFSDGLIFLLKAFEGPEVDLAYAVRTLEALANSDLDVTASNPADRALSPALLTTEDVADIARTNAGRDLAKALAVAVAGVSAFPPTDHAGLQTMADQRPIEPYSPDKYDRRFTEGQACFEDAACALLRTWSDLTKDNFLMTIDYTLGKDFRWVDLNLPDPSEVPEGEEASNQGQKRMAMVARSWTPDSFTGRGGNSYIHQSFTSEAWIPRSGGGSLRILGLWTETEFDGLNVSDDQVVATTRTGIDKNFDAADDYLEGR